MKKKSIASLLLCLGISSFVAESKSTGQKPNIIVILADDVGYGSVGCYGATKVRTPNIDRIAQEGIRFTDANTPSSVCTPTRYSLMTGEYPWRQEIGLPCHPERMLLPANRPNVASMLKSEGYATGVVGKWHLGFGEDPVDWQNSLTPGPLERGFDYYFGFPINLNNAPSVYIENHQLIHPEDPLDKNGRNGANKSRVNFDAMTDVITGKAVSFIEKNKDQPFFLYYATHQVHVPVHPAPRFVGTSDAGIYGDYIQDCDWSVGQILETLDRLGLTDNTLVFFTSDNGAEGKGFINKAIGLDSGTDGEFGFYRNAPWSGFKFSSYQGGSRVPFLARWTGNIQAGSQTETLISLTDFYATFRDLLGRPDDGHGMDSYSFLGHMLPGHTDEPFVRDYVVYQAGSTGFLGLREKEWMLTVGGIPHKLLSMQPPAYPQSEPGTWGTGTTPLGSTLYNLTNDPKEKVNVYEQYPEVVRRMERILEKEKVRILK
jgi:arylsulfatase A